jgi:hypothetical protein
VEFVALRVGDDEGFGTARRQQGGDLPRRRGVRRGKADLQVFAHAQHVEGHVGAVRVDVDDVDHAQPVFPARGQAERTLDLAAHEHEVRFDDDPALALEVE